MSFNEFESAVQRIAIATKMALCQNAASACEQACVELLTSEPTSTPFARRGFSCIHSQESWDGSLGSNAQ